LADEKVYSYLVAPIRTADTHHCEGYVENRSEED